MTEFVCSGKEVEAPSDLYVPFFWTWILHAQEVAWFLNVGFNDHFLNILLHFIHLFCIHLYTSVFVWTCICHGMFANQRISCMHWVDLYFCYENLRGQILVFWSASVFSFITTPCAQFSCFSKLGKVSAFGLLSSIISLLLLSIIPETLCKSQVHLYPPVWVLRKKKHIITPSLL